MTHPSSDSSLPAGVSSTTFPASRRTDQPLDLAVHAMPMSGGAQAAADMKGRWKMLAVLLVCAAPVIASYFTYYVVRPEARRNFGDLIEPQRPMVALATQALDGKVDDVSALKGQWLLVAVAGGACGDKCEKNLYFQRQLRESLGKEKGRLDRVWLVNDSVPVANTLTSALAGAAVLRVDPAALSRWLAPGPAQSVSAHLYVVDPLGNWMMRFPADLDASSAAKAKRDLDRLLRASSGWDKEGRDAPLAAVTVSQPTTGDAVK